MNAPTNWSRPLAKMNDVDPSQISSETGSGEILKLCADVFTGPLTNPNAAAGRGALVVADPTFEAILIHAKLNDAEGREGAPHFQR